MAVVDRTGITPTDLTGYRALLEARFRSRFGADVALDPETPLGQIIGIMALSLAETDEALVFEGNGRSVLRSVGVQLHDLGSLLNILPFRATRSTVTLTLTGAPGTEIPSGARVRTNAGAEFTADAAVTIPAAGTAEVTASAVEEGPVEAAAGTLTEIVTLVAGWTAVTNAAEATPGRLEETDPAFRARYAVETARLANGPLDALEAALSEAGALRWRVEENFTDAAVTRQGLSIGAHSVMCIIQGGEPANLAAAILRTKSLGVGMSGAVAEGDARFQRVVETPISVTLTTTPGDLFPADGVAQIRANLVDYVAGQWASGDGDFETEGLGIGDSVDRNRLLGPITAIPGHRVSNLVIRIVSGSILQALPAIPTLNNLYTLAPDNITITLA